ncbi:MAG: insulinase family protein [Clostridia bacterium]
MNNPNIIIIEDEKYREIKVQVSYIIKEKELTNIEMLSIEKMLIENALDKELLSKLDFIYSSSITARAIIFEDIFEVSFQMKCINPKYLPIDGADVVKECLSIFKNKIENPCISLDFVKSIKEELLTEENIDVEGIIEVKKLNKEYIYNAYKRVLKEARGILVIVGSSELEYIANSFKLSSKEDIYITREVRDIKELRYIEDSRSALKQSRIYKRMYLENVEDYIKFSIYNNILDFKLSNIIREEKNLAYVVGSQIDKYMNLITFYAGIKKEDKQEVLDVFNSVIKEKITEDELSAAKLKIIEEYINISDDVDEMTRYVLDLAEYNLEIKTINETIDKIKSLNKEDIFSMSKNMKEDLIIFIGGGVDEDLQ